MKIKLLGMCGVIFLSSLVTAKAQQTTEPRVPLTQAAIALDGAGSPALEATLRTTSPNGTPDSPVTNISMVIKNVSPYFFGYISGVVTFYDSAGLRCGEGLFKADVLAPNESVETDAPGIRIRCSPATWRVVATNLVLRTPPLAPLMESPAATGVESNLLLSVDGEEHPIQLDKPMVVTWGDSKRTIVVRRAP
jgi:hypothetical protein